MFTGNDFPPTQQPPAVTRLLAPSQQEGFAAAVGIPLSQSLVTGALCGLTVGSFCWAMSWPNPEKIGLVGSMAISTGMWVLSLAGWQRRIERVLGVDLNGDGYIGQPPATIERAPLPPVKIEVISDNGRQSDFLSLPAEPEQLKQLGQALTAGETFSVHRWTGPGGLFSRSQFDQLKAELVNRGMLRMAGQAANQGFTLTSKGKAVMRGFASMSVANSPTLVKK